MMTPKGKFELLMESITPKIDQDTRVRAGLSFFNAGPRERRRRMQWFMRLSDEYRRVSAIDVFGTGLMWHDMERVIDGEFIALRADLHFWLYEDEREEARARYAELHRPWRLLLEEYVTESEATLGGLGDA